VPICLNIFRFGLSACFAYDKVVINQRRVEKSAFEDQSEEIMANKNNINDISKMFCLQVLPKYLQ